MSICTFIAADVPLAAVAPPQEPPLETDPAQDTGYDGVEDDGFFLHPFPRVEEYTDRKYGVWLEWEPTENRASRIIDYIKAASRETDTVELWHVWLADRYGYADRPFLRVATVSAEALTEADILALDAADVWDVPDRAYPNRPSFYRLSVTQSDHLSHPDV